MSEKKRVQLVVAIEPSSGQWHLAAIDFDGNVVPLARSEGGNLDEYFDLPFDEQVSFLRHRLSGALQIGCDRLWAREMKPSEIVFLAGGKFKQESSDPNLTVRVAEHFVEWMTSPPVTFYLCEQLFEFESQASFEMLAGEEVPAHRASLESGAPTLKASFSADGVWEDLPPRKKKS